MNFKNFVFNPEMIKLLFDNDEINKLKFKCQTASIHFNNRNIDAWNFTFDRSIINESLEIGLRCRSITEENINYLLELLLNEGYRFPQVTFDELSYDNQIVLYNNLINHLETSTISKIVANIKFDGDEFSRFGLIVRGVEMSENNDVNKHYKITNIYDPKMMFSIFGTLEQMKNFQGEYIFESIEIIRIK